MEPPKYDGKAPGDFLSGAFPDSFPESGRRPRPGRRLQEDYGAVPVPGAAGEALEQAFEPRHAFAQIGHVAVNAPHIAAKLAQARDDQPRKHNAGPDDGDDDGYRFG